MKEKLASPPIVEVVCGLFFDSIPELDPITVGKFWHDLRSEYPQHAIHQAVADQTSLMLAFGPGPLRSWFISANDEYLIQIQHDRFYLNWRKREAGYPRFNDYGKERGVMSRALAEFGRFSSFCSEAFGATPRVRRVEVAKVDLLVKDEHWRDSDDLAKLMPLTGTMRAHATTEDADLTARIMETRPEGDFLLSMHAGMQSIFGMMPARGLRLETRLHRALQSENADLREQLASLNDALNDAFVGLFDPMEFTRFGKVT